MFCSLQLQSSTCSPGTRAKPLDAFFAACDERESSPEPDWEVQRRVLAMARSADLEPT